VAGSCEHGNGPLGSVRDVEYFGRPTDCQLLNETSILWSYLRVQISRKHLGQFSNLDLLKRQSTG
jgi:hypothetical protein